MPYTLKKINIIISKVNIKYWSTTHKYEARLPNNLTEAMNIDQASRNTYWKEEIDKDTKKSRIVYKLTEECTPEELRKVKVNEMHVYHEITCHVIFDVNMDFTRNVRFLANDSKNEAPFHVTYSNVVPRDIVQLELLTESLNDWM